jgi:hypothetical protein
MASMYAALFSAWCFATVVSAQTCLPSWTALSGGNPDGQITSLCVFNEGTGPALIASGWFTSAGGVAANHIAKWDGQHWSPLGGGLNVPAGWMVQFDDGSGPALIVTQQGLNDAGGAPVQGIAKWSGGAWHSFPTYLSGTYCPNLTVQNINGVQTLFARAWGLIRYDGGVWNAVLLTPPFYIEPSSTVAAANLDGQNFVFLGGSTNPGHSEPWPTHPYAIYPFDGTTWTAMGLGAFMFSVGPKGPYYTSGWVTTIGGARQNGHSYAWVTGTFHYVGGIGTTANGVARWSPSTGWSSVGPGIGGVESIIEFDDGRGPSPYFGGSFTSPSGVLRVSANSTYEALGTGVNGTVHALAVFDDGSGAALFAGGTFTQAGGGVAPFLARWGGTPCYPNCDGSKTPSGCPSLNVADFNCFLERFTSGDLRANCDNSSEAPVLNVQDFTCFLQRYSTGCP